MAIWSSLDFQITGYAALFKGLNCHNTLCFFTTTFGELLLMRFCVIRLVSKVSFLSSTVLISSLSNAAILLWNIWAPKVYQHHHDVNAVTLRMCQHALWACSTMHSIGVFNKRDWSAQFYAIVAQFLPQANSAKSRLIWIPIGMAEFYHKNGNIPPKVEGLACMYLSETININVIKMTPF